MTEEKDKKDELEKVSQETEEEKDIEKDEVSPVEETPESKPVVPIKPEEEKDVNITKKQLNDLLNTVDELKKSNEFLVAVADKRAVATYYQRHKAAIPSRVKVGTLEVPDKKGDMTKKVVIGWSKMIKNNVWKDPEKGHWKELQTTEISFEDGSSQKMHYVEFVRQLGTIECKKIGTITDDETGELILKLVREDNGKELNINAKFVNP